MSHRWNNVPVFVLHRVAAVSRPRGRRWRVQPSHVVRNMSRRSKVNLMSRSRTFSGSGALAPLNLVLLDGVHVAGLFLGDPDKVHCCCSPSASTLPPHVTVALHIQPRLSCTSSFERQIIFKQSEQPGPYCESSDTK